VFETRADASGCHGTAVVFRGFNLRQTSWGRRTDLPGLETARPGAPGYTGITFNPSYTSGNRITGVSYDGDGHVTNDGTYTYTYNAEGRMATVSGTTAVYDAFTRLVELQASSGTQQLVYAPDGFKFAYMNGQTVQKYIAPGAPGSRPSFGR